MASTVTNLLIVNVWRTKTKMKKMRKQEIMTTNIVTTEKIVLTEFAIIVAEKDI